MRGRNFKQNDSNGRPTYTDDSHTTKETSAEILEQLNKLQKSQKVYRRTIITFIIFFILILGAALAIGAVLHYRQIGPIPRQISSQVDFPLYYPTEFPSGFSLDKNSFSETNTIVTYTVTYDGNKKLVFNTQARPTNFDFDSFQSKGKKLESSLGDAYVGALGKSTVVSIATDKSWLLIGVPSPIDTPSLAAILQHLKEAR